MIPLLLVLCWVHPSLPVLYCVQCSSSSSPTCLTSPPSPTLCSSPSSHCLTTREYQARTKGNYILFLVKF